MNTPSNAPMRTSSLFSTARGNTVKISLDSLTKAKSVLSSDQNGRKDIDEERPHIQPNHIQATPSSHFTPTIPGILGNNSNYIVPIHVISSSSSAASSSSMNNISHSSVISETPFVSPFPQPRSTTSFQTAKGTKVKISKEAIERTKALFHDNGTTFDYSIPIQSNPGVTPSFTASKDLWPSLSKRVCHDSDKEDDNMIISRNILRSSVTHLSYITSDDQPINRFDEQLAQTEFQENSHIHVPNPSSSSSILSTPIQAPGDDIHVNIQRSDHNILFQTGRGRAVTPSDNARANASKIFNMIEARDDVTSTSFPIPKKRPRANDDIDDLLVMNHNGLANNIRHDNSSIVDSNASTSTQASIVNPVMTTSTISDNIIKPIFIVDLSRDSLLRDPIYLRDIQPPRDLPSCPNQNPSILCPVKQPMKDAARYQILLQITSANANMVSLDDSQSICICDDNINFLTIIYDSLSELPLSKSMKEWVDNQLSWIIWMLASYERKYPDLYFEKLLSLPQVISGLSARYKIYNSVDLAVVPMDNKIILSSSRRKPGHVSAKSFFSHRGAMSPLQRVAETLIYRDPMILCFSIHHNHHMAIENNSVAYDCYVTDGWYTVHVMVDAGTMDLINRGKLRDGTKVIIFAASIRLEGKEVIMSVTFNNIRKARGDAKLGFCHPKYLDRGIAIKSIVPDGGSVFAVRVKVVHICSPMSRLKIFHPDRKIPFYQAIPQAVMKEWRDVIDNKRMQAEEIDEDIDDVEDMIDSLNVDDWIKRYLTDFERNGDFSSQLTENDYKVIMKAKERLDDMKRKELESRQRDIMREFEVNSTDAVDVLVRCLISSSYAWIRIPIDETYYDGNHKAMIDPEVYVDNEIIINSLAPAQHQRLSIPLYYHGKSFSVMKCKNPALVRRDDHIIQDPMVDEIVTPSTCLRDLYHHHPSTIESQNQHHMPIERSFSCYVVEWRILSCSSANPKFTTMEIQGTDTSFVSVLIEYSIPTDLSKSIIRHLDRGNKITIHHGIITSLDNIYDVIKVSSGDRTIISHQDSNDLSSSSSSNDIKAIYIDAEGLRVSSLRDNKMDYLFHGHTITCSRIHWHGTQVDAINLINNTSSSSPTSSYIIQISSSVDNSISFKIIPSYLLPDEWIDSKTSSIIADSWIPIHQIWDITFAHMESIIQHCLVDGAILSIKRPSM